jgi:outer membrane protein assembly factor BamE (lipoprotein component of BamABCDE complex)
MKITIAPLIIALTIALTIGCASVGEKFDMGKVDQIKKGETTQQEIVQMFGKPSTIVRNSNGETVLSYMYVHAQTKGTSFIPVAGAFMGGVRTQSQTLSVILGPDGKVKDFNSAISGAEMDQNASAGSSPNNQDVQGSTSPSTKKPVTTGKGASR